MVLTAADAAQAGAFREQLREKLRRGSLPRAPRYLVCPDPPGARIGERGTAGGRREHTGSPGERAVPLLERVLRVRDSTDSCAVYSHLA